MLLAVILLYYIPTQKDGIVIFFDYSRSSHHLGVAPAAVYIRNGKNILHTNGLN